MSVVSTGGYDQIAASSNFNTIKSRFSASEELSVPSDLRFTKSRYGAPLVREPVKVRVQNTSYVSNGNNEVILQFPNDGIYHFQRGYLTFDVAISVTGGTYRRLAQGVWSIWYRMKTLLGFELENMQEYGKIFSLLWDAINDDRQSSVLAREMMGIGTQTERNAWGTITKKYACPLLSGFFDRDPIPLNMYNSVAELRLTMGDPATFVETDGTQIVVTVTNFKFHCERISATSVFYNLVKTQILTSGLTINFATWQYYTQSVPTGTVGLFSSFVNHKSASMSSIIQIWTPQNAVNNPLINDRFTTFPCLTYQHQWKIFGKFFPEEPVVYTDPIKIEPYFTYLNWLTNEWQLSGDLRGTPAPISAQEFSNGDRFFAILDLNGYPDDLGVINAISTENSTVNLQYDAYITAPLVEPMRQDFFVKYQKQIYLNPQGVAVVTC